MMFRVFAAMLFFAWSGASIAQPVDGAAIFKRCVACHQPNGKGIPGSYPPLKGHLGRLASSAVGREYLIMVLSAGLVGEIKIDTQTYRAGALDVKTKELLGLVASMVLRCDDCITYHVVRCHEEGVTREEFLEVFSVGLVVGGSIVIPHLRRAMARLEELQA